MSMEFHQVHPFQSAQFDIFDWHPKFLSCLRYFLDHAQHQGPVQAVAEFVNIQLPFQQNPSVSRSNNSRSPAAPGPSSARAPPGAPPMASIAISLIPYIRRLVVTGFDTGPVLHGFFGDDWHQGIGPIHETERRNYLFAAKSDTWVRVKAHYDMPDGQTVPFMVPLQNVTEEEIQSAERYWSNWLAMQDWMLGPRAPDNVGSSY